MPRTESIRIAEKNIISHLASAARQSVSIASSSELPFRGMDGPRDPVLLHVASSLHIRYPLAEWIRVKRLSRDRLSITIKATGMKAHARGYGIGNALLNICSSVERNPALREAITQA